MQEASEITHNTLMFCQGLLPLEPHYLFFQVKVTWHVSLQEIGTKQYLKYTFNLCFVGQSLSNVFKAFITLFFLN